LLNFPCPPLDLTPNFEINRGERLSDAQIYVLGPSTHRATPIKPPGRPPDTSTQRAVYRGRVRPEVPMQQSRMFLTIACATLALLVGACGPSSSLTIARGDRHSVHSDQTRHHGPPPHAPSHGYRHKHRHQDRDLDLVFDSDLGAYIVLGVPDRYYWNGYYLRIDGDQWYASLNLDSGWKPRNDDSLPPGMKKHKKHPKNAKGGKPKKAGPAKGRW
jgi:hypothetical protein